MLFLRDQYHLKMRIGIVYLGTNIVSKQEVAIKLESLNADHLQLENEIHVYKNLSGGPGIPSFHWFGAEGEYNALVLERLGPSLEELFNRCNRRFSLKTVLMLSDQLVSLACAYALL
jgi:casein kinase I family protein HRR25